MGGRYYITGVQLGMLIALERLSRKKLVDEIIDKQFVGNVTNTKTSLELIDEWWNDKKTCSGKPHCTIEDCDLCVDCFERLREKIIGVVE